MNECMRQAQDPGERASQAWGATPPSPVSSSQGLFWDAPSPSPWLPHPSSQLEEAPPESPESPHRGTDHCTANASSRVAYDWGPPEGKGLPRPCSFSCPRHRGRRGGNAQQTRPAKETPEFLRSTPGATLPTGEARGGIVWGVHNKPCRGRSDGGSPAAPGSWRAPHCTRRVPRRGGPVRSA